MQNFQDVDLIKSIINSNIKIDFDDEYDETLQCIYDSARASAFDALQQTQITQNLDKALGFSYTILDGDFTVECLTDSFVRCGETVTAQGCGVLYDDLKKIHFKYRAELRNDELSKSGEFDEMDMAIQVDIVQITS